MSRPHRVMCVGETMAMVSPTTPTSLTSADAFTVTAGGAESNVASHLAGMGIDTLWLSRLGDDALGDRVLQALRETGVGVEFVERDPSAQTGVYFKDPVPGRHKPVSYYRSGSAASRMSTLDLQHWPIETATWIHTSGITAALSESCSSLVHRLIDGASPEGYRVSFDVNYRPALWWTPELAAARILELGQRCEVLLVGLDEAQLLWDVSTAEDVGELFADVASVVIKDGANEAVEIQHSTAGSAVFRSPAHKVEVIEAIGAGDAFAAGFLSGYLRGDDPLQRLAAGHELAAWTLGSLADHRPLPTALSTRNS